MTRFYCFFFSTLENICTVKFFSLSLLTGEIWKVSLVVVEGSKNNKLQKKNRN